MEYDGILFAISTISATTLSIITAGLIALLSIQYKNTKEILSESKDLIDKGEFLRARVRTLAQLKFYDQNQTKTLIKIYQSILFDSENQNLNSANHYYENFELEKYDIGSNLIDDITDFIKLASTEKQRDVAVRKLFNLESIYTSQDYKFRVRTLESIDEAKRHSKSANHKIKEIESFPTVKKCLLFWLFLVLSLVFLITVIYPIGLTPIDSPSDLAFKMGNIWAAIFSFKGFFLTLIYIVFLSVIWFSYWQIPDLGINNDIISDLKEEAKFSNIHNLHNIYRESFSYDDKIGQW